MKEPQEYCRSGHAMAGDNLYTYPDGRTRCRTCKRLAEAERRAEYFKRNYTTGKMVGTLRTADIVASRPANELVEEAAIRAAAPHRDLAGMTFGDPRRGYSALDRMHGGGE